MKNTGTTRRAMALGLAGLLATSLVACGGQSLEEVEGGGEGEAVDLTSVEFAEIHDEEAAKDIIEGLEPVQEIHDLLPAEYKSGLTWTTSSGYPPMELFASNNTDLIGVDPALAHAISRVLGVPMEMEDADFNAMIPGLVSGRYDVLISSMTDTEERRETTTFVNYVQSGNAFLVEGGNPLGVEEPMDLCGQTVAVVDAGSSAALAEELSAACEEAGEEPYEILPFPGDQDANLSLESGRSQATVTDYPVAVAREADENNNMDAVVIEGGESVWGIGVDNSNADLAVAIEAALQHLMDEGAYAEILAAWEVDAMAIDAATINGE